MTTTYYPRTQKLPLLFIAIVITVVLVILASTHAVITHGTAAIDAQHCFSGQGQTMKQVYEDPLTFRQMSFCNQNGHWFISIDGHDGGNVTMFPRSFAKCLRDVIEYANRSGFTRLIAIH